MNLLSETEIAIRNSGHDEQCIIFIGSENSGHCCTWEQFKLMANQEYYAGYGAQKVATDLIIAFSDETKMWRFEYDGSECWTFSIPFNPPKVTKRINRLIATDKEVGWVSLSEMNGGED